MGAVRPSLSRGSRVRRFLIVPLEDRCRPFYLSQCAAHHLAHYVGPAAGRAFAAYDRVGPPSLTLLFQVGTSSRCTGRTACTRNSERHSSRCFNDPAAATARFKYQELDSDSGPWALVRAALRASDQASGFRASGGRCGPSRAVLVRISRFAPRRLEQLVKLVGGRPVDLRATIPKYRPLCGSTHGRAGADDLQGHAASRIM